jgi:hypothetical protein
VAFADARRLVETLSSDMGNDLSEAQRQLVQRAALVGAIVADFEARWVAGQPVQLSEYLAACNVQRRILVTLGLRRQARDVTPSLDEILDEDADRLERERAALPANQGETS